MLENLTYQYYRIILDKLIDVGNKTVGNLNLRASQLQLVRVLSN